MAKRLAKSGGRGLRATVAGPWQAISGAKGQRASADLIKFREEFRQKRMFRSSPRNSTSSNLCFTFSYSFVKDPNCE